jgi:hypothetical protein
MVRRIRLRRRPAPGTVLGGLALIVATSGVAVAAIPSSSGVITGCYNAGSNPSGQLRLIDVEGGAKCTRNERQISWSQQGPPGADGTDGTDGTDGADGVDGVNGATNVVVRYVQIEGEIGAAVRGTARCQSGERAIGGGFDAKGNGADLTTFEDRPDPADQGATPTGWYVNVAVPDITYPNGIGRVYVVCASP